MSPTLASVGIRAHKTITSFLTVAFLSLWLLGATQCVVVDVLGEAGYLTSFLSISLLTYLICRSIVFLQGNNRDGSMAYRLTSAHHRHSRREALLSSIFSIGWIYSLFCRFLVLFLFTIYSSSVLIAHNFGDEIALAEAEGRLNDEGRMDFETSMSKVKEMADEMGFDIVERLGWLPWKVMVFFIAMLWVTLTSLFLYVMRITWKSLAVVLRAPQEKPAPAKLYVA